MLIYPEVRRQARPPAVGLLVQVDLMMKPVAVSSKVERATLCPRRW